MISYEPLWHTLLSRGMNRMEMIEAVDISRGTLARLGRNDYVSLAVIEKICLTLDCTLAEVVDIRKEQ